MTAPGTHYTLPAIRGILRFTPDRTKFVISSYRSELYFYSTANVSLLAINNETYNPYAWATQELHFSSDSETVIVETGWYHPVKIISMSNYTVLKEFSYSSAILIAAFMKSSPLMFLQIHNEGIWILNT